MARLMARWVLPTPGGPRKITFSLRSMKPSSCRLSICSRRMLGWKLKSKPSSVLTAGSLEERMAAWRRRLFRSLRRPETPPGVQAQHDWFEVRTTIAGERVLLPVLVGTLSHSRARFAWASRTADQLAWHTGHLELFRRYGGVPLWVRIDNLKTGVAKGAGASAVLNRSYAIFARECGFEVDPCRPRKGSDKGKTERSVRTFRSRFGDLFERDWSE